MTSVRIAIIGAGPAGVMAAAQLVQIPNIEVYLFDKGKPLQTLLATGGGRCNLSYQETDPQIFSSYYPRGGKFLLSVWQQFFVEDTIAFFANLGLATYAQPDRRIFPCSNQASEVRNTLLHAVASAHVITAEVIDLRFINQKFQVIISHLPANTIQHQPSPTDIDPPAKSPRSPWNQPIVQTNSRIHATSSQSVKHYTVNRQFIANQSPSVDQMNTAAISSASTIIQADYVILASGGNRLRPQHSGYTLASKLGHHIIPLRPSLCSLITEPADPDLAGISLTEITVTVSWQGKLQFTVTGDLVFTHHGISGPLAYKISAYAAYLDFSPQCPLELTVNWLGTQADLLKSKLQQEPSKKTLTSIAECLPKRLAISLLCKHPQHPAQECFDRALANAAHPTLYKSTVKPPIIPAGTASPTDFIQLSDIQDNGNLSNKLRQRLIQQLTHYPLLVTKLDRHGEIVTAGGVDLAEISQQTMASKLNSQLYFAGEVMNIDGLTGGFNLQMCWSTGFVAGNSIRKLLTKP